MIIIDYLGLLDSVKTPGRSREQDVSEMSRKAKLLAKELDIPVILLSQLNRSCESRALKRPELADLRESGAIEQDADIVILVYRAEKYGYETIDVDGREVSSKGVGELIVAKHRNGRIGSVAFKYNDSVTRISDYADSTKYPDYDRQFGEVKKDPFPDVNAGMTINRDFETDF
jgi:replicative DNA helicase